MENALLDYLMQESLEVASGWLEAWRDFRFGLALHAVKKMT